MDSPFDQLTTRARKIRVQVIEMARAANKGHIGSALSIADIIAVVATLRFRHGSAADTMVLSKGHAASALFAALMDLEVIPDDPSTYCADASDIATHPMATTPGIDFSTGSLGQGVTYAVGAALAQRISGETGRTWCILSDAELNEGSTWEAAQVAAARRLGNLAVVVDLNGQQATARTDDVLPTGFVGPAWSGMGWDVLEVDGHAVQELLHACEHDGASERPRLVIARTVAGKGISFMEGRIEWHYLPLTDEQYSIAMAELRETAR